MKDVITSKKNENPNKFSELINQQGKITTLQADLRQYNFDLRKHTPFLNARAVLLKHSDQFGKFEKKSVIDYMEIHDKLNCSHIVLKQIHGKAEVYGACFSVHYKHDGNILIANSTLKNDIKIPAEPKVLIEQAIKAAIKHAGKGAALVKGAKHTKPRLMVYDTKVILPQPDSKKPYVLCWQFFVERIVKDKRDLLIYLVDALNGSIICTWSGLYESTNSTGYYSLGTDMNTSPDGSGNYITLDAITTLGWGTSCNINSYDCDGGTNTSALNYCLSIGDDVWGDFTAALRKDEEKFVVDGHRYLGIAASYFHSIGFEGFDTLLSGTEINVNLHYGNNINYIAWDSGSNSVLIGDGDNSIRDFMGSLDLITHEFSHAIIADKIGNCLNTGETGALYEGIADTFGFMAATEQPAEYPEPLKIGARTYKPGYRPKNVQSPSVDGVNMYDTTDDAAKLASCNSGLFPDHYSIRYASGTPAHVNTTDFMFCNNSIISHALYLMARGGTHRLSSITVAGIGDDIVESLLYYVLVNGFLSVSSAFIDLRLGMINACTILYSANANYLDYLSSVKAAFKAVGIGPDLFIRDTLTDTGIEPGTLSCMSPDIINRQNMESDPGVIAQLQDAAEGSLCQMFKQGQDNYVYFRIFNAGPDSTSGTFRLFVSPVSTFNNGSSWVEVGTCPIPAFAGTQWNSIDAATATEKYVLFTSAEIDALLTANPGVTHFCFIGVIESSSDPAPDRNQITTMVQFYQYIANSNNFAWRNCDVIPLPPPPPPPAPKPKSITISRNFKIDAMEKTMAQIDLEIDARNLPEFIQLQLWFPRHVIINQKVFDIKLIKPQLANRILFGPLQPLNPGKYIKQPVTFIERLVRSEKVIPIKNIRQPAIQNKVYSFNPGTLGRISGIYATNDITLTFTITIPGDAPRQPFQLAFRQLFNEKCIGQMNYQFEV